MRELIRHLGSAVSELRRRRIYHVLAFYGVAAWLVVEITDIAVPALHLPAWTLTLVFYLALLGFPVVAVLTWAYDLTPEGIERTGEGEGGGGEGEGGGGEAPPGERPEAGHPTGDPTRAVRSARLVLAAGVLLMTAALGWMGWQFWFEAPAHELQAADPAAELDRTRIAVLYFDDYSETGDLGYLAAGLTEALIHELAQVPTLDVVSRYGVKPFRGVDTQAESPARALRAGSLVEGSVQRSGDRLRVTVQLVDGATGVHLESETLERPWGELFELQDDLVRQVSDLLRRRLGIELRLRSRRAQTESVEAWTLVRKAEEAWDEAELLAMEEEGAAAERLLDRADSLLAEAEELDRAWVEPPLVRGWVAAARAALPGPTPDLQDPTWYERGLRHAARAIDRGGDDPRVLELRGSLRYRLSLIPTGQEPRSLRRLAEEDLQTAVGADPSLARAWAELSDLLRVENREAEAKRTAERALAADAFLSDANRIVRLLYQTSLDLGSLGESGDWCEHGRQRFPDDRTFVACGLFLLALDGGPDPDVDAAWRLLRQLLGLSPPASVGANRMYGSLWLAATLARAANETRTSAPHEGRGRTEAERRAEILADSARAVAARAREDLEPATEPPAFYYYYRANVHLLLGEHDEALRLLELHLGALPGRKAKVANDWMFRPLWDDPRFQALVDEA